MTVLQEWQELGDLERDVRRRSMEAPPASEPAMQEAWRASVYRGATAADKLRSRLEQRYDGYPHLSCECGFTWKAKPSETRSCPACGTYEIAFDHEEAA